MNRTLIYLIGGELDKLLDLIQSFDSNSSLDSLVSAQKYKYGTYHIVQKI